MGRKIAKVAVAKAVYAIDRPYDYLIPPELEGRLRPGMRVLVPFGAGNRGSDGVVLSMKDPDGTLGYVSALALAADIHASSGDPDRNQALRALNDHLFNLNR